MFLLLFAVPALLVVILGYVVGYSLWSWIGGRFDAALGTSLADGAEPVGWTAGVLLLLALVVAAVRQRRAVRQSAMTLGRRRHEDMHHRPRRRRR